MAPYDNTFRLKTVMFFCSAAQLRQEHQPLHDQQHQGSHREEERDGLHLPAQWLRPRGLHDPRSVEQQPQRARCGLAAHHDQKLCAFTETPLQQGHIQKGGVHKSVCNQDQVPAACANLEWYRPGQNKEPVCVQPGRRVQNHVAASCLGIYAEEERKHRVSGRMSVI